MSALVLVCGSRSWTDRDCIRAAIASLNADDVVMHGAARGADSLAAEAANSRGLRVESFPADWATNGKRAGILRNIDMLDRKPDLVLAFHDGTSRGTVHTISEARKRGIAVRVYEATDD